jgi:hypothetical protein
MDFIIELVINGDITANEISINVDDCPAKFIFKNNSIIISADNFGFHVLKLTSNANKRFSISNVRVGGCDLRKLIYMSYLENEYGEKFQPATELWESKQTWVLPFGYPLSGWIESVEKKIPNNKLGQNLIADYLFYYPESVTLEDKKFPQIIRDYYKYNFNFTIIDRSNVNILELPFITYQKQIPIDLLENANNELLSNLEFIKSNGEEFDFGDQRKHNHNEFQKLLPEKEWRIIRLHTKYKKLPICDKFPAMQKIIDSINVDYRQAFIGLLPPGGFIYPHIDDANLSDSNYDEYRGCTQLYIPLHWPSGASIKFAGAGIVSLESGKSVVVNNDHFTHSAVNASAQDRYVLAIRCHKDILKDCYFNKE